MLALSMLYGSWISHYPRSMDLGFLKTHYRSKYAAKPPTQRWRKGDLNVVCDR